MHTHKKLMAKLEAGDGLVILRSTPEGIVEYVFDPAEAAEEANVRFARAFLTEALFEDNNDLVYWEGRWMEEFPF